MLAAREEENIWYREVSYDSRIQHGRDAHATGYPDVGVPAGWRFLPRRKMRQPIQIASAHGATKQKPTTSICMLHRNPWPLTDRPLRMASQVVS